MLNFQRMGKIAPMLTKLTLHRTINKSVKLAVKQRLEWILADEEGNYQRWKDYVKPKMLPSKATIVDRAFKKRIQAFKIVIYCLTPREMRDGDMPTLFERKK